MEKQKRIPPYVFSVKDKIGSGAFGSVFKGINEQTKEAVAIKVVKLDEGSRQLRTLEQEIHFLKAVKHSNVVGLLWTHKTEHHIYLIMEYCAGGDLAQLLRAQKQIPLPRIQRLMRDLAAGLQCMRSLNLIHRDLKPQNLLLSTRGEDAVLKIADFGLARYIAPQDMAATACGSPLYMAPEILAYKNYGPEVDLWSVGTILYEMATGKRPYEAGNPVELLKKILKGPPAFPIAAEGSLLADCVDLMKKLLVPDPEQRLPFEQFFTHPFLRKGFDNNTQDVRPSIATLGDDTVNSSEGKSPIPVADDDFLLSDQRQPPIDLEAIRRMNLAPTPMSPQDSGNTPIIPSPELGSAVQAALKQPDPATGGAVVLHQSANNSADRGSGSQNSGRPSSDDSDDYVLVSAHSSRGSLPPRTTAPMPMHAPRSWNSQKEQSESNALQVLGLSTSLPLAARSPPKNGIYSSSPPTAMVVHSNVPALSLDGVDEAGIKLINSLDRIRQRAHAVKEVAELKVVQNRASEALSLYAHTCRIIQAGLLQAKEALHVSTDASMTGSAMVRQLHPSVLTCMQRLHQQFNECLESTHYWKRHLPSSVTAYVRPEKLLLEQALLVGREAAVDEVLNNVAGAVRLYTRASLLIEQVLMDNTLAESDQALLKAYASGFGLRLADLRKRHPGSLPPSPMAAAGVLA